MNAVKDKKALGPKATEARAQRETNARKVGVKVVAEPKPEASEAAEVGAAPPPVEDVTGKKNEAVARKQLAATVEKKVIDAVASVMPEGDEFYEHAVRYGRKIAKKDAGLRASDPPLAGLSKERGETVAAAVREALGA